LIDLINKFGCPIVKFECDQGTEFSKFKTYCKENNILFKFKYGANKANFAENIIQILKRRLYKLLRGTLNKNWPGELEKVVTDYNNLPNKRIGYLRPNDILSKFDSAKVRDALATYKIPVKHEPSFKQQQKNQQNYEQQTGQDVLKEMDFVYVDLPTDKFGKSFDYQVNYSNNLKMAHLFISRWVMAWPRLPVSC